MVYNLNYERSDDILTEALTMFWELEELSRKRFLLPEDSYWEKYFPETSTCVKDNCFVIRLHLNILQ